MELFKPPIGSEERCRQAPSGPLQTLRDAKDRCDEETALEDSDCERAARCMTE